MIHWTAENRALILDLTILAGVWAVIAVGARSLWRRVRRTRSAADNREM